MAGGEFVYTFEMEERTARRALVRVAAADEATARADLAARDLGCEIWGDTRPRTTRTTLLGREPERRMAGDDRPPVRAEAWSDDRVREVRFDAGPYLARATDEGLRDLARIGWGGDYAADEVAYGLEDRIPALASLLSYVRGGEGGFEVHLDADDTAAWAARRRPHLELAGGGEGESGEGGD